MNKKTIGTAAMLAGFILAFSACYYDKEQLLYPSTTTCGATPSGFAANVLPFIQASCDQGSGCHGAGSGNGPGALTNYTQIKNAGVSIQSSVTAGRMPLGSHLSTAQIQMINCWVANGMLNN
ncbi:MAG TPA: hypothetical protein VKQ52_06050 [Puia sp.]|nr:hypothetical protein [Puia sp.]